MAVEIQEKGDKGGEDEEGGRLDGDKNGLTLASSHPHITRLSLV